VDLPIDLMGVSLTVWSMNISGTFEPDGEAMSEVSLAGALDMREVAPHSATSPAVFRSTFPTPMKHAPP
jgi:hypothetical protein